MRVSFAFFVALCCSLAVADEASHRASAERFLTAIDFERDVRLAEEELQRFVAESTSLDPAYQLSPQEQSLFDSYVAEVNALRDAYFDPRDLREDAIRRYMDAFSEEELIGFSEMFESPIGQLYVERMIAVQFAISDQAAADTNEFTYRVRQLQDDFSDRFAEGRGESNP